MKRMNKIQTIITTLSIVAWLSACGNANNSPNDTANAPAQAAHEDDHTHDEVSLGSHSIGGIQVGAAQGHGSVEAGKEGHLVIKLPYSDNGASTVRVWIGSEDRTLSSVGKGDYDASHDDYDTHAVAPDPLPEGSKWWVEIEKPDGTKAVGSLPFLKDLEK